MKILVLVYNRTDSCSFYRAGGIFPDIRRRMDVDITILQWNQIEIHWQEIIGYDLIYMQRPFSPETVSLCNYLKNFGIPVWVDYDDNLLEVPAENKHFALYGPETRENIKQILGMADMVTVTSPELAEAWAEYITGRVEVVPNAFNDYLFPKRVLAKTHPNKLALWRGSDSHIHDIMTVGDRLNKIFKISPDWQFLFLGFFPWYLDSAPNLFHLGEMDVMLYFKNALQMGASLLHTPLADTQFNRAKSNIAYLEASYFGAACLCPAFPEWTKPGALNYDSTESYYKQFKAVINKEIDIKVNNSLAWDYVVDEMLLSRINLKRIEIIQSLV